MSKLSDNKSAEVVLRAPRVWSNERKCLDKCLKRLSSQERDLVLHYGKQSDPRDLVTSLKVSGVQLKKIRARLEACINKCLEEVDENLI